MARQLGQEQGLLSSVLLRQCFSPGRAIWVKIRALANTHGSMTGSGTLSLDIRRSRVVHAPIIPDRYNESA